MIYSFDKKDYGIWAYPQVYEFDEIKDRVEYKKQFSLLDMNNKIKIYIHIPFCIRKCVFCPFYKEPYGSLTPQEINEFFQMLWKEIAIYANLLTQKPKVFSVYFGGGDPACVEPEYIEKTIQNLREYYDLSKCEEIIFEGNAKSLNNMENLHRYKEAGIDRISFGVQTFDPDIRKKLALRPSLDDIYQTIEKMQKIGVRYDIDMMYNLPDQDKERMIRDLEIAFRLPVTYLSYYQLTVMPNTKFDQLLKDSTYTTYPPTPQKDMELSKIIMKKAAEMGMYEPRYMCYSTMNNSRKDNTLEKICYPVLAFGPSSKSTFYHINYKNVCSVSEYVKMLKDDCLPTLNCYYASKEDMEEYELFNAILTMKFQKKEMQNYGRFENILNDLVKSGYFIDNGEELSLTDKGKVFIGNIQYLFINEEQKRRRYRNVLSSRVNKVNPYNQDKMGIPKTK